MAIINGTTNFLGVNQSDSLSGTSSDDTITADPGTLSAADTVNAGDGNDVIYGGGSSDFLNGENGNDTIYGELGNDNMAGGEGADTYVVTSVLGLLAGNDTINNFSNDETTDILRLSGFFPGDINNTVRDGNDLLINYGLLGDSIRLTNFYLSSAYRHLTLEFDGSVFVDVNDLAQGDTITGSGTLTGTAFADTITGSATDDTLIGNAGNDVLNGQGGADILDGGTGNDVAAGGTGDDTYVVDVSTDVVTELAGEGNDTVVSGDVSLNLNLYLNVENLSLTGSGDLSLTGDANANILTGNAGDNTLTGNAGHDVIDGGAGVDSLIGGLGDDTYVVDQTSDTITELAGEGTDTVQSADISLDLNVYTEVENATLLGSNHLDVTGDGGNNILIGNSGDNTLDGGAGDDTLIGGDGNDTYILDSNSDSVIELTNQGDDTVVSATISLDLAAYANVENAALTSNNSLSLTGNSSANTLTGNSGNNTLDGGLGNDLLIGGGGDDTLIGGDGDDTYIVDSSSDAINENASAGNDTIQSAEISLDLSLYSNIENASLLGNSNLNLTGDANNNLLIGNSGNNTIDGGAGNDTMIGGDGNDTYIVHNSSDVITELPNQGTDTVQSALISLDLSSYSNVENATLTGGDHLNLTGDANTNILTGNSGNNTLDGGVGDDSLIGGEGDDTYIVDSSSDVITELANQGLDTVQSATIDLDLGNYAHVEQGQLLGNFDLDLTGNSDNNTLLGNSGTNTLSGLAGNDSLDGGTGTDVLIGGEGDDLYTVDDLTDSIVELADQGSDTVQSAAVSLDLLNYANVESALLLGSAHLNLTGNTSNNTLTGNNGNNTLDGGSGDDVLVGGDGDDLYIIDSTSDVVVEGINSGTDTIQSDSVSIDLLQYANVEHATLTGSANLNITGSHDAANILTGNAGNNMIIGNALNDTLIGNDGDDTLDGSGGKDIMMGGLGNDTYYVSTLGDQVTELSNQGTDTVIVGFSYTLGAHVENLSLTGNGDLNGTGNVHNNTLLGTSGNNILLGGGGVDQLYGGVGDDLLNGGTNVDSLYGGDGNDTYYVNLTGDQVFEQINEGIDTVNSLVDYTLGNHVEHLVLGGTDHLKANGNALDNQIIGNSGNNLINGGLGDNLLIGGAGNDQYRLNRDFGTNTVLENAAEGTDTVQFGLGVLREQVWLSRVDDDLVVQIIGTNANVVVQDWYSAGANIEQFRLLSGRTLMAADVDTLVNAMASLTPPAFGETTLSAATKNALGTVFADTWNTIT